MEIKRKASFADRLWEAMTDAGKKQIDLVRETGLDRAAINRYLAGENEPRQKAVNLLAKALGVDEMWLWGYDVPKVRSAEQKKNDDLVKAIARMRKDPDFFDVVSKLATLPSEQYASAKTILLKAVDLLEKYPDFFDVVSKLAELPPEQYASVKTILAGLGNK